MDAVSINKTDLTLSQGKAWGLAALFVIGNILLPQLCHLMPHGGLILLPIYMFTLVGTLMYGWQVGLLVALVSPILNSVLFGMPHIGMVPIITIKGVMLASAIALGQIFFKGKTWKTVLFAVLGYQLIGCMVEIMYFHSLSQGLQDLRIGFPGILIQLAVGIVLVYLFPKHK